MTTQADLYDDEDVQLLDNGNEWVTCWQCGGEGMWDHDCGEDCCACLHPEDNVRCDICRGVGGWERDPEWKKSTGPRSTNE
jgi:hypothetical protein